MNAQNLEILLLCSLNILAGVIAANLSGIGKRFTAVEKKVDQHISDYSVHHKVTTAIIFFFVLQLTGCATVRRPASTICDPKSRPTAIIMVRQAS